MYRVLLRLKQHWVRHLLAALQVAVGVSVVTAVFVDVVPALRSARSTADTFRAIYGDGGPFRGRSSAFTIDDAAYLEAQADTVMAASVYENEFLALLRVDGDLFVARSYAWVSPGFETVAGVRLVAGRFFDESDLLSEEPEVALISSQLAEILFPGRDPVGQVINIRPRPEAQRIAGFSSPGQMSAEGEPGLDVRVIGVYEHPEGTPSYSGFFAETMREELLLPANGRISRALSGAPRLPFEAPEGRAGSEDAPRAGGTPVRIAPAERKYFDLYFRAVEGRGQEAAAEVEALLAPRIQARNVDSGQRSLIISPAPSGAQSARMSRLAETLVLGAMGMAALIVAGFSIFTTFLAGVAERIRSIGIARALGATRSRIVREIVGEAVTLAGIGALIGIALSYPVRTVALRPLLTSAASPSAADFAVTAAAAFFLAVGIGALAALYPGWTAARLSPAEALYEE